MAIDFEAIGEGGISGAVNKVLDIGAKAIMAPSQAHYERKNQRAAMDYANKIARQNALDKYTLELESMQKAGVNTGMLGGDFKNAGVAQPSVAGSYPPDMTSLAPADVARNAQQLASADNLNVDAFGKAIDNGWKSGLYETQMKYLQEQIGLIQNQKNLTAEQKNYYQQMAISLSYTWPVQVQKAWAELHKDYAYLESLGLQNQFDYFTLDARIAKAYNDVHLQASQLKLNEANMRMLGAQTKYLYELAQSIEYDNQFASGTILHRISSAISKMNADEKADILRGLGYDTELSPKYQALIQAGKMQEAQNYLDAQLGHWFDINNSKQASERQFNAWHGKGGFHDFLSKVGLGDLGGMIDETSMCVLLGTSLVRDAIGLNVGFGYYGGNYTNTSTSTNVNKSTITNTSAGQPVRNSQWIAPGGQKIHDIYNPYTHKSVYNGKGGFDVVPRN